jgi:hypothetical protein
VAAARVPDRLAPLKTKTVVRLVACSIAVCIAAVVSIHTASGQAAAQRHYKVDPFWPKELPHKWIVGQNGGMAVDRSNHIWTLQRPGSNTPDEISADPSSPRAAMCCVPAPPVLVFDAEGNLLKSWGGPGHLVDKNGTKTSAVK